MGRSIEESEDRIRALEKLVSSLRHDVNGALTPALMVADSLRSNSDARVQRAGTKIADSILRVTQLLRATRDTVPPMGGKTSPPEAPQAAGGPAG